MTDNQKTELEEAINCWRRLKLHVPEYGASLNGFQSNYDIKTIHKTLLAFANIETNYILIRRDDVPEGFIDDLKQTQTKLNKAYNKPRSITVSMNIYKLNKIVKTARLVQAAMEDK